MINAGTRYFCADWPFCSCFISADDCYWVCETVWPEEGHEWNFQGEVSSHQADSEQDKKVQIYYNAPSPHGFLNSPLRAFCCVTLWLLIWVKSHSAPFLRKLIGNCDSSPPAWRETCELWARSSVCSRSPRRWLLFTLRSWCCRDASTSRTGSWWRQRACCWLQRLAAIWGSQKSNSSLTWVKFPQKQMIVPC